MSLRSIIIIIVIIIFAISAALFYYFWSQGTEQPNNQGQDYVPGTGDSPTIVDEPGLQGGTGNAILWFTDNDSTGTISYDLKRIPEDYFLNGSMESLDSDVNNF